MGRLLLPVRVRVREFVDQAPSTLRRGNGGFLVVHYVRYYVMLASLRIKILSCNKPMFVVVICDVPANGWCWG